MLWLGCPTLLLSIRLHYVWVYTVSLMVTVWSFPDGFHRCIDRSSCSGTCSLRSWRRRHSWSGSQRYRNYSTVNPAPISIAFCGCWLSTGRGRCRSMQTRYCNNSLRIPELLTGYAVLFRCLRMKDMLLCTRTTLKKACPYLVRLRSLANVKYPYDWLS